MLHCQRYSVSSDFMENNKMLWYDRTHWWHICHSLCSWDLSEESGIESLTLIAHMH